jgi:Xaa-Pro aminopeptidase
MLLNLERARDLLARDGLDAVVVATPINVIYASDFASEFLLGRFEDFTAAVVIAREAGAAPTLIIPEFDLPYLAEVPSWIEDVQVYGNPWSSVGAFMGDTLAAKLDTALRRKLKALRDALKPAQAETFLDAVEAVLRRRGLASASLACDEPRLSAKLEARGIGGNRRIADAHYLMRRIRMVKTAAERAILTEAAAINAEALAAVIAEGRAGLSEAAMTRVYRRALLEREARHLGERGMMFGANDASSFSLPAEEERKLAPGDAVVLDCLGAYRCYHMDLARTGIVGAPSDAQKRRYDAVLTALREVEARIKPGVHTQDLRRLVRETIGKHGFRPELASVTTHGIGLELFEFPDEDALAKGFALEAGNVVNTEVFYRDPELGSFHLEDSVAVTAAGAALLHPMPRDLVVFH